MSTSQKLDKLLDKKGKKYYEVLAKSISKTSTEPSISALLKKYSYKLAALSGLLFEYVHEDCGKISCGSIGVGMIALSVSPHDDLTDERPSDPAAFVHAGDVLMGEGFRIFAEECHDSRNFLRAFKTLSSHTNRMWEFQQKDTKFFARKKISLNEYFEIIGKSREWAKIGLVPAAILCGKKTNDYIKIGGCIGNIFQVLDDITEVEEDKGKYCSYFSCNLDGVGLEKAKDAARKMIDKERQSLSKLLLTKPKLRDFGLRLMEITKNI